MTPEVIRRALPLLVAYASLSAVLFAVYGFDKMAAKRGGQRVPELTLHVLALAGGWPGALLAQRVFRHKTRKQPFQTLFRCTAIVNCVVVALIWASLG